jgi:riboflavin-specific deaminase-like protein
MPLDSHLFRDTNALIITTKKAPQPKLQALEARGIETHVVKTDSIQLDEVMKFLRQKGIISVLVEGGGKTIGSFVDKHYVDKVYAFYGPLIIGGADAVNAVDGQGAVHLAQAMHLTGMSYKKLDDSFMISGYISYAV